MGETKGSTDKPLYTTDSPQRTITRAGIDSRKFLKWRGKIDIQVKNLEFDLENYKNLYEHFKKEDIKKQKEVQILLIKTKKDRKLLKELVQSYYGEGQPLGSVMEEAKQYLEGKKMRRSYTNEPSVTMGLDGRTGVLYNKPKL